MVKLYEPIFRIVCETDSVIKDFRSGLKDGCNVDGILLETIENTIAPHMKSEGETVEVFQTFQILSESSLHIKKLALATRKFGRKQEHDQDKAKLLSIGYSFVKKLKSMQDEAFEEYLAKVHDHLDKGSLPTTIDHLELPIVNAPVPKTKMTAEACIFQHNNKICLSMESQKKVGMPIESHHVGPSRKPLSVNTRASNVEVKKEFEVEGIYRDITTSSSRNLHGKLGEQPRNIPMIGVISMKAHLEVDIPWESMEVAHQGSNIGQFSNNSCPFCTITILGKRSAITKHVREMHKDLWNEFAPLICRESECDYRATNVVTMKAHMAVSHGEQWKEWRRNRLFELPDYTLCPFCPNDAKQRLRNLSEYRCHVEAHHQLDIVEKSRSIKCVTCGLLYQHSTDLFFHWSKRGNTFRQGACLVPVV